MSQRNEAKTLIECRFSIKGMSRTYIENVFGQEFADQVYHVHIKPSTKKLFNTRIY